jgi:hypothetical protein
MYKIKLAGRSLADFIQAPKGPTIVDFLQAQEEARSARLASLEESILKKSGAVVMSRTTLPNGGVRIQVRIP